MSKETTSKPALTAEEWAKRRTQEERPDWMDTEEEADSFVDNADCGHHAVEGEVLYCRHFDCGVKNRHGLAALALHDQPYGFTWEDVDRLRHPPELYGGLQGTAAEREWWATLNGIADRIASLLPPRETPQEGSGSI